jgi:hypothetical protein
MPNPKLTKPATTDEEEIPPAPPEPLRGTYLKASWSYIYWCAGMFVWAMLCVTYFVMTRQTTNMVIGIALGAMLVAMIALPTMLFGGKTWYKRLGWMMLLLAMFTAMWIYPIVMVIVGIAQRKRDGRYHWPMTTNDIWHVSLCVLTFIMSAWTIRVAIRTARLVRQLARGEFHVTDVKIRH